MTDTEQRALIHVVDDDGDLSAAVSRLLVRNGYDAIPFIDPAAMLDYHANMPAHCIVTDVMMGDMDGFAMAQRLRIIDATAAMCS